MWTDNQLLVDKAFELAYNLESCQVGKIPDSSRRCFNQSLTPQTITFIDLSIDNALAFVVGTQADVKILLDQTKDGVTQITEALNSYRNIKAVSIISHGSTAEVRLGNGALNTQSLIQYENQIRQWRASLVDGADILFYGCNVADGEIGQTFIRKLSDLTGADVAASINATGNSFKGGDWTLEYSMGSIETLAPFTSSLMSNYQGLLDAQGPTIDVWYGTNQRFGHLGKPQTWINVLGNVFDPDGVQSLSYSLNGGPQVPLTIGIDALQTRRLTAPGDFNIDIAYSALNPTPVDDTVVITAKDTFGNTSITTVTIDYESGSTWSPNYSINWEQVNNIQDVVQVVDGFWTLTSNGIRSTRTGYDRAIAIGDISWRDYEVTVPVTVHKFGVNNGRDGVGAGILMRWTGHTDNPVAGFQPKAGFFPFGTIGWYTHNNALEIWAENPSILASSPRSLLEGVTYNYKMRVETSSGHSQYKLKVWQQGLAEPVAWDLQAQLHPWHLQQGSLLLLAHFDDVTFGNVNIISLEPGSTNQPPSASDDNASVTQGGTVSINVLSNDSDSDGTLVPSSVAIGTPPTHGTVSINNGVVTYTHNGSATTSDSFTYTVQDDDGATSNAATVRLSISSSTPTPTPTPGSAFSSDDFNSNSLNSRWSFVNPLNDGSYRLVGAGSGDAYLELVAPAGSSHDLWNNSNRSVRVMQATSNTDFGLEAKFASQPTQRFQMQGILVEQDVNNWIRFDTYHDGASLYIFAATTVNGASTVRLNTAIAPGSAPYLRVNRQGNQWTLQYSGNGSNWTTAGSFTHTLNATAVGTFAANHATSGSPPAFTSKVDYFFNTASPISPEDGNAGGNPPPNQPPSASDDNASVTQGGT
ncbi:MAG: DUF4347 domain-containing protein, partial [Synechococcales cyanobacterium M58_A2018_015]|nr:DUF4347 domain-containing protein [Synechococcales cyanobacterium M58_A2018_015]